MPPSTGIPSTDEGDGGRRLGTTTRALVGLCAAILFVGGVLLVHNASITPDTSNQTGLLAAQKVTGAPKVLAKTEKVHGGGERAAARSQENTTDGQATDSPGAPSSPVTPLALPPPDPPEEGGRAEVDVGAKTSVTSKLASGLRSVTSSLAHFATGVDAGASCRTVDTEHSCYRHIDWAFEFGLESDPGGYPGMTKDSTFEDWQSFFKAKQSFNSAIVRKDCSGTLPDPCPAEVRQKETKTTADPPPSPPPSPQPSTIEEVGQRNGSVGGQQPESHCGKSAASDAVAPVLKTDTIMKGGWDTSPIVLKKYKLILFTVPKVACTVVKQLARRIIGKRDWRTGNDWIPHDPGQNGLTYLRSFTTEKATAMMNSPDWTRAIFLREPKERLLSAYLDKAVKHNYVKNRCRRQPRDFKDFVSLASTCNDPHWGQQTITIADKFWPKINFIGRLSHKEMDMERLLRRVGLWEQFGANGWGEDGKSHIFASNALQSRATGSKGKMEKHFTPSLEQQVHAMFVMDTDRYDFFDDPSHKYHNMQEGFCR